jgi:hypothetical protein
MRNIILLALIAGGLVAAGVITIQNNGTSYNITVDKNRLQNVEHEAAVVGTELLHQAQTQMEQAAQNAPPQQQQVWQQLQQAAQQNAPQSWPPQMPQQR